MDKAVIKEFLLDWEMNFRNASHEDYLEFAEDFAEIFAAKFNAPTPTRQDLLEILQRRVNKPTEYGPKWFPLDLDKKVEAIFELFNAPATQPGPTGGS